MNHPPPALSHQGKGCSWMNTPPKNHKTIGHSSAKKSSREITLDFEKVPVRRLRRDYLDNIEDDPSSPPSPPKKIPKKNKDGHHVSLAEKVETFIVDNILLVGMAIALAMALLASKVIL